MTKTLGLKADVGQIQWAIVEDSRIVDGSVLKFNAGFGYSTSGEYSLASERTEFRLRRRQIARTRKRKTEVLRVLVKNNLCPPIPETLIDQWKERKIFPAVPELVQWLAVNKNDNPYKDRYDCINRKLDLSSIADRYVLGRAMYHLCQRRGYKSNAKEPENQEMGKVLAEIASVTEGILSEGCTTLGEYLYALHSRGEGTRRIHTGRECHVRAEFDAICDAQGLTGELRAELERAIFFQRPLRSQKYSVGRCVFLHNRYRAQVSHPVLEEVRMIQFINNIRLRRKGQEEFHPLTTEEIRTILPLFFRKSKENFNFSDISKAIAGKKAIVASKRKPLENADLTFNYDPDTLCPGCPTLSRILPLTGQSYDMKGEWKEKLAERYSRRTTEKYTKTADDCLEDIYRVIENFDDREKKTQWFQRAFPHAAQDTINAVASFRPTEGYGMISVTALKKMMPFLKEGWSFQDSARLASVSSVTSDPSSVQWMKAVIERHSGDEEISKAMTKTEYLDRCLQQRYGVPVERLWDSSKTARFKAREENGLKLLADARTSSLKNPVVSRTLSMMARTVNTLLRQGRIDSTTTVRLLVSDRMNSSAERQGIELFQKKNRNLHETYAKDLRALKDNPSSEDIEKYRLWEEQRHVCLFSGRQIGLNDIFGNNPSVGIVHIVPLSRGGDDTLMNKVLAFLDVERHDSLTGAVLLPSEMPNYHDIRTRIQATGWDIEYESQRSAWIKGKNSSMKATERDTKIQKKRTAVASRLQAEYFGGKLWRLRLERVPRNLSGRDSTSATVSSYATDYLKSVFDQVESVNIISVNILRKMWLIPSDKQLDVANNADAITAALCSSAMMSALREYWIHREDCTWSHREIPEFPVPWESFTSDVVRMAKSSIVRFYSPDRTTKNSRRVVRDRNGRILRDSEGRCIIQKSARANGELYEESFYGIIKKDGELKAVIRKPATFINKETASKVVDERLQAALGEWFLEHDDLSGFLWNKQPLRHVRVYTYIKAATLVDVKKQTFESDQEWKRCYHCSANAVHAIGVYGKDVEKISVADATRNKKNSLPLVPETNNNGHRLDACYKKGQHVLFYGPDETPDDIKWHDKSDLAKRLYVIFALAPSLNLICTSRTCHLGKTVSSDAIACTWSPTEASGVMKTTIRNLRCLVEGKDFTMDFSGRIIKKTVV